MRRYVPLKRGELKRRVKLLAHRRRRTGPTAKTAAVVMERAGHTCEWPACRLVATDLHHRLNRKMGGRRGERSEQINLPSWLLAACRFHHERVTSASGDQLQEARDYGWVLNEHEVAAEVPVAMDGGAWLLADDGSRELLP